MGDSSKVVLKMLFSLERNNQQLQGSGGGANLEFICSTCLIAEQRILQF